MAKYTVGFKLGIVKHVLSGIGKYDVAKQYGVNKGDVQKWVAAYEAHGEEGLKSRGERK